jgi:hypothetical protein
VVDPVAKAGDELDFEGRFDGEAVDRTGWLAPLPAPVEFSGGRGHPVPLGGGVLRLLIEADQPPRVPGVRRADQVSSLQTGVVSGPVSSIVGQSRFKPGLAVREGRDNPRLHMS